MNISEISEDDMIKAVVDDHAGFPAWFEVFAKILTKGGEILTPQLNRMQEDVVDVVKYCLENKKPIRLIILKPRQKGCSTISTAIMYWLMCRFVTSAVLIGGQYDQVDNLWKIFKRYAAKDLMKWGFSRTVMERTARFDNGSELQRETAGDDEAGRAGTYQFMLATESARWKKANAADVLIGILNCIPFLPRTCVILESTARGPSGFFYDYWQAGVTFEDFKAGKEDGYVRIFSPWFDHDDSRDHATDDDPKKAARVVDSYTDDERQMVTEYNLSPGQIVWHRRTLETECKRDPIAMGREYPKTPEEAFHASANNRFNNAGMKILRQQALQEQPQCGVLEQQNGKGSIIWRPTGESDCFVKVWEPPRVGMRYLIAVDVMTGASQTEGADPDWHSALCIRDGYFDAARGQWKPPKVVGRVVKSRWDIDILEEWVYRLSVYFGNCLIVPEANMDRGLIMLLKDRGANLYERQGADEKGDIRTSKPSGRFGFMTTSKTRDPIIENLARHIREWDMDGSGIEIPDIDIMTELEHFAINDKGRAEAATGFHDDDVLSLAIGMAMLGGATTYHMRHGNHAVPSDLRDDFSAKQDRKRLQFS